MRKALKIALFALWLSHLTLSACPQGTVATSSLQSPVECISCLAGCKKCSSSDNHVCEELLDEIDGAFIDGGGNIQSLCVIPEGYAYNKKEDTCQWCAEGCASCLYDHNICTSCKVGWDYNRDGRTCLRATLGLTAVNFIVAVGILAVGIFTCIKSTKLG